MEHETQVSAEPTAVTDSPAENESGPAASPSGDVPAATGAAGTPGATGAKRRRRRGGRGRGRGGSGPSTPPEAPAEAPAEAPTEALAEAPAPSDAAAPAKRSSGQRRRPPAKAGGGASGSATTAEPASETQPEAGAAPIGGTGTEATGAPKKRRRRRGGRGRGKKPAQPGARPESDEGPDAADGAETKAERRAETEAAQRDEAEPDADVAPTASGRRRRRRSPAGEHGATAPAGSTKTRQEPKKASKPRTIEEQVASGGPTRRIRATRTRTGRDGRRRREPLVVPPRITDKLMVITERGDRDQIAVLEEDVLVQHYVTRAGATSMVGNVYLGRVQNVLPGMEAAFIDVGRGRNGVLYAGEVNYSPEDIEGPAPRIEQLLKPGQGVMVQVTKDPMGGKGARLTANLSLAGRYLVLAPNQNLQGISRRLPEEARTRLKTLLKRVKPPEHGVIVRTAAEAATEEALESDLRRLLEIWDDITKKAAKGKAPTGLYEEPELTVRVVRDLFTDEEYRGLVTDSERVYRLVTDYVREVAPDLAEKVTLHQGPLAAFEEHRIVEQIHKALDRKVWLPSGGYLIIERTEAMTIIDVNTGKSVGKTNLEETVVNTNLEAARESARQLRLRDIGGIIVIDFIDMLLEKNKKQVEDTMRDTLAVDKTRSQVFEIGPLGLMQVTRKRVSSGLVESFSETCPTCEGRGIILTYDTE